MMLRVGEYPISWGSQPIFGCHLLHKLIHIILCPQENLPTTHQVSENFQLKLTVRENVGSCIGVSAGASRGAGARAAKLYFPEFLNSDIDGKYIDLYRTLYHSIPVLSHPLN